MAFINLTEGDKRVIFALFFLFFLVFFIIGYIGVLIVRICKKQGEKIDNYVADPVIKRIITNKKHFIKYANKKNNRLFYKNARIPVIILLVSLLTLIITNAILGWNYNIFANQEKGFASILFIWDFSAEGVIVKLFDVFPVLAKWAPVSHYPEFKVEAIGAYLFVITLCTGGIWYLCCVTTYVSRMYRIYYLARKVFSKNLENYNSPMDQFLHPQPKEEKAEETPEE